jgi:hypothetical protein
LINPVLPELNHALLASYVPKLAICKQINVHLDLWYYFFWLLLQGFSVYPKKGKIFSKHCHFCQASIIQLLNLFL